MDQEDERGAGGGEGPTFELLAKLRKRMLELVGERHDVKISGGVSHGIWERTMGVGEERRGDWEESELVSCEESSRVPFPHQNLSANLPVKALQRCGCGSTSQDALSAIFGAGTDIVSELIISTSFWFTH